MLEQRGPRAPCGRSVSAVAAVAPALRFRRAENIVGEPVSARSSGRAAEETLAVAARDITISNSGKVLFPQDGYTKLDVGCYYLALEDGVLRAAGRPPNVL